MERLSVRFDEIVVDCADPGKLARFWAAALGYELVDDEADLASIEDPISDAPAMTFQRVTEVKNGKNRVHFDLTVGDEAFDAAKDTLLGLGAHEVDVGQGEGRSWAVLADPEGNEFCLVT
jgi:hypothetical protein